MQYSKILILFIFVVFASLFSATEAIISSGNRKYLKDLSINGNRKAKKLIDYIEKSKDILLEIQLSFFSFNIIFIILFLKFFIRFYDNDIYLWNFKFNILSVFIFSLFVLIFIFSVTMIFPKKLATNYWEKTALNIAVPMCRISRIFRPFVIIIDFIVFILLKMTGQNTQNIKENFCEDDVMSMLEVGQEIGVIKEEGKKMINSIFAFDDKLAYEVMTPRTDVFTIDIEDPYDEYVEELMELKYSRIPVYKEDSDNIIGILNIKDYLIKARETGFENVDIYSILRKPYFVPETKNIDSLFFDLQSSKQHIAILIDEYGGFSGIVTMEDIIEEVMGNIDDEYDEEELPIQKLDDSTFIVDGSIDLDDLNEELSINIQSDNSETLGGFLIDLLGEIPEDGRYTNKILEFENYIFKIESVKEKRIEFVHLHIVKSNNLNSEENNEV